MSWLSGYQYRKLITISGSAGAGTGYQVLLRVGESANADADFHLEGHALNFPNDIRFTAADGVTELAHWLEKVEGVAPDRTAYFWVKVEDSLDSDVFIYCYYGQEGGVSGSDGFSTFLFFDDFNNQDLTTPVNWSVVSGSPEEGLDGRLYLPGATAPAAVQTQFATTLTSLSWRFKTDIPDTSKELSTQIAFYSDSSLSNCWRLRWVNRNIVGIYLDNKVFP